jgi:hypothetical protein
MMPALIRTRAALLGLCLALGVSSCSSSQTHALVDVTKPAKVSLAKRPGQGNIHALHLRVEGDIDGGATLAFRHPGEPSPRTFTISGKTSRELFSSDWYADTVELEYTPSGVTRGRLSFHYRFSD